MNNLYSFNCRGLRDKNKRLNIFQWLKISHFGIVFLQETHSLISDEERWENEFNGSIFFSHGSSNSKGVAILIPINQKYKYINALKDNDGRILLLHCFIEEQELVLINIYAPTKDHHQDQLIFLEQLMLLIEKYGDKQIVLGGDFNTCLDPNLDKLGGKIDPISKYTNNLLSLQSNFSLVDIWRIRNPQKRQYTRRERSRKDIVHSRLDFWLVSRSLEYIIKNTSIHPGNSSDHSIISLHLCTLNSELRGKGTWKFPNNLLYDETYCGLAKNIIYEHSKTEFIDKSMKWEFIKCQLRTETIAYSKTKAKKVKEQENLLLKCIQEYESDIANKDNSDINYQSYLSKKLEWENIQKVKTNGAILRSKVNWVEDGEKNSKFFLGLEKRNYNLKYMKSVINEQNREITDPKQILQEQTNFYGRLYTSRLTKQSTNNSFWNNFDSTTLPKLDQDEKVQSDSPLTLEEIGKALKDLVNDKSPGSDGFTTNFYKFFWPDIKHLLLESYQHSFETGALSQNQKIAILNLIPKKDKDIRLLKNWRPISLLNTDYKILTKVLAKRLQKVIDKLISHDQVGYIKGRYIGENLRIIADLIDFSDLTDMQGMIALIDFEKAFDSIEWPFLFETLEIFNFGKNFIHWIKTIYKDIKACTCNNGFLSNFFPLTRSIRQGCPISALLFILVVEILAHKIRDDQSIKGIEIGDFLIKIRQLADDTSLFLKDLISLENSFKIFEEFERAAGLKLNAEKTEIIPLGILKNTALKLTEKIEKVKINQHAFKTLGVWFSHDKNEVIKLNFDDRIQKIEKLTYIWSCRNLSWKGKITIIKSLLIPQIQHLLSVLYVPDIVLKKIDKILFQFLWSSKPARIKRDTITSSIEEGGLKMPDIYYIHASAKISLLKRLLYSENNNWTPLMWKLLNIKKDTLSRKLDIEAYNKSYTSYHHQLLVSWYELKNKEPVTKCDILNEYICDNIYIPINENVKHKLDYNVRIIDFYSEDGTFCDINTLNNKLNIHLTFIEYYSLKNSIPTKWKANLSSSNITDFERYPDNVIKIGHKVKLIEKLTQNEAYWELISRSKVEPTSINVWVEAYPFLENTDWGLIRALPFKIMREPYLQTFQYKILHRTINCNYNLFKWKIRSDPNCQYCGEIDTLEHHFFSCQETSSFWNQLKQWVYQIVDVKYNFTICEVLLGIIAEKDNFLTALNSLIFFGKYHINKCRSDNLKISFLQFIETYRFRLLAIEKIHKNNDTEEIFNKTHGLILNNL